MVGKAAGVVKTFGGECLTVDPLDPSDVASALHIALTLPVSERQERLERMRQLMHRGSKIEWILARAREINAAYWRGLADMNDAQVDDISSATAS